MMLFSEKSNYAYRVFEYTIVDIAKISFYFGKVFRIVKFDSGLIILKFKVMNLAEIEFKKNNYYET